MDVAGTILLLMRGSTSGRSRRQSFLPQPSLQRAWTRKFVMGIQRVQLQAQSAAAPASVLLAKFHGATANLGIDTGSPHASGWVRSRIRLLAACAHFVEQATHGASRDVQLLRDLRGVLPRTGTVPDGLTNGGRKGARHGRLLSRVQGDEMQGSTHATAQTALWTNFMSQFETNQCRN
jgi:hypothetical protein